jgi:uncharacterized protein (DUF952 family)
MTMPKPHRTLHLTPVEVWEAQRTGATYTPEAFAADGFIHCTDRDERLMTVANLFYQADPRPFLVLTVDLGAVTAQWLYEDAAEEFPHIYGPLETAAVVAVRSVRRDEAGRFLDIG